MRRFTLIAAAALALAGQQALAQQDPRFTHYYYNQQAFNPAAAGLEGSARFMLLGRSQWLGYNNDNGTAPNTGLFSFASPLLRANSGIGLVADYETFAAVTSLDVRLNYNYQLAVGGGKLSIGVAPGLVSSGRDANKYRPLNPADNAIPASTTEFNFDLGAGVYYRTEKFFVGLSARHLTAPVFTYNGAAGSGKDSKNTLVRHYYGIAGYNFVLNPNVTLTPSVLFKSADFASKANSVEGNVTANFNNRFSVGAGYTQEEAVNILLGLSLLKDNSLRLGYAIDLVTQGERAKQTTSQEIMLAYQIPVVLKGPKPAIRTPRYRK